MLTREDNELLTNTDKGSPMGELFRRFWIPVALSDELPGPDCVPVKLRIMSEDLIAFRDTDGKVGVIDENCPHRGSSMIFARNDCHGSRFTPVALPVRNSATLSSSDASTMSATS